MALIFLPIFFFDARPIPWEIWYQPFVMGIFSFLGQACAWKAISSGDLTLSTPALGSKVILVALLTEILLHQTVPLAWWLAAACSFAAVFFLQAGLESERKKVFTTLLFSFLTAACFAMGDVLIQKWAPGWGVFHFVPVFAIATAFYSLCLIPILPKPLFVFPATGWKWMLSGTALLGIQGLIFTVAIGLFGKVTQTNIIFSTRGLWNFIIIWFIGNWFGNHERKSDSKVMRFRFVGAGLMFLAIILAAWH